MAEQITTNGNGSLLKGLTVVLGMAAVISPLYYQVQAQQSRTTELGDVLMELMRALHVDAVSTAEHRGKVDEQLVALRDRQDRNIIDVRELDDRLQREMRDVNAVTDAKLQGLDQRLQGEIGNITRIQQDSIDQIGTELEKVRRSQASSGEFTARLEERIAAIRDKP